MEDSVGQTRQPRSGNTPTREPQARVTAPGRGGSDAWQVRDAVSRIHPAGALFFGFSLE